MGCVHIGPHTSCMTLGKLQTLADQEISFIGRWSKSLSYYVESYGKEHLATSCRFNIIDTKGLEILK